MMFARSPLLTGRECCHNPLIIREFVIFLLAVLLVLRIVVLKTGQERTLTPEGKAYLLNLARQTLIWHLRDQALPNPAERGLGADVRQRAGCFVTLVNQNTGLRGCLGIFTPTRPLYKNVISRAVAAAHDSRFMSNPVSYAELKNIKIEISVLTEPQNLEFDSPEDLLSKLRPGVDGVILSTRYGSSTYLPQVWESFPGKETFLSSLCEKHGAPADTWRKDFKHVKVQIYQAVVFGEEISDRNVVGPSGAVVGPKGARVLGAVSPLAKDALPGGGFAGEGTRLAPGTIVSWSADIQNL